MMRALRAEFMKLRASRTLLWTSVVVLAYSVIGTIGATAFQNSETAKAMGAAGGAFANAAAAGLYRPSWANFLRFIPQGIAGAWGVLLFGFVTAYVFGREAREGTEHDMLTLPVRREYFVVAKMAVVAVWVLGLTVLSVVLQAGGLALLGLDGFAWSLVLSTLKDALVVSAILYLTLPVVGWLTMVGHGYLRAMLFSIAMMMTGTALATTSLSRYFPWNMPIHLVGASWMPIPSSGLAPASWVFAVGVFALGLAAAVWRIDHADSPR
jgi:ABC-2 type transport system permease protein